MFKTFRNSLSNIQLFSFYIVYLSSPLESQIGHELLDILHYLHNLFIIFLNGLEHYERVSSTYKLQITIVLHPFLAILVSVTVGERS